MRPGACARATVWVCAVLSIALVATACSPFTPRPALTPSSVDPDYAYGADRACMHQPEGVVTSGPYPPDSVFPVGQSAEARIARLKVPQIAQQRDKIGSKQAHGVWVVVQIAEQYIGTSVYGLPASPLDFQLIDPRGAVHCMIFSPTKELNLVQFPDIGDPSAWQIQLLPNQPSTVFWLAFDVDPELVAGSYLLAYNMTHTESVNLDLGLT